MASLLDKLIIAAEVVDVGKDAQCRGSVLLIAQGDDTRLSLFLNPSLGGRLALELGDDARGRLHQSLSHTAARHHPVFLLHLLLHQLNHLAGLDEALALIYLNSLVSDDFFQNIGHFTVLLFSFYFFTFLPFYLFTFKSSAPRTS